MSAHKRLLRVGRLGPWHRRASYVVLAACGASGLGWFLLLDAWHLEPPQVVAWWVLHGLTGLAALVVIGSVLATHVPAAWRHHRNRGLGGTTLALFAVVLATTGLLMYGKEDWHAAAHWLHVIAGLAVAAAFTLHAVLGRRSQGRPPR
ncbi:MAG: hypothetical protein ACTHL8_06055 [Burkholderiaceae bacterium]